MREMDEDEKNYRMQQLLIRNEAERERRMATKKEEEKAKKRAEADRKARMAKNLSNFQDRSLLEFQDKPQTPQIRVPPQPSPRAAAVALPNQFQPEPVPWTPRTPAPSPVPSPEPAPKAVKGTIDVTDVLVLSPPVGPTMYMDIEGEAGKTVEVHINVFDAQDGFVDCLHYHQPENMNIANKYCHALGGEKGNVYSTLKDPKDELTKFWNKHGKKAHCMGAKDIKEFLELNSLSGGLSDIMPLAPKWVDRKDMAGFKILSLSKGRRCSRKSIHGKLHSNDKTNEGPHCAETDCLFYICIALGRVPDAIAKMLET
uniref:Nucleoprotein exonuclease domain n=1 Tax=Trematomus arenavirus TaxID=3138838 RepID=A0AAU7LKF8_9VIRU